MKKTLSIFLLSLWLLFNYSRLWTYRECPAMAFTDTKTVKCDCERQSPEASSDKGQPGADQAVSKQKTEEVFAGGIPFTLSGHLAEPAVNAIGFIARAVLPGFSAKPFQPPRFS